MAQKILLADDSVTAQNMGRKILADAGYDVVTVNNGPAALKRIHELMPDIAVLDVYMPGYSGIEVCERIKEDSATAHIPVLLTVGKLEPFKQDEATRVRADAHIVKPFEASELLKVLARLSDRIVPAASRPATEKPAARKTAAEKTDPHKASANAGFGEMSGSAETAEGKRLSAARKKEQDQKKTRSTPAVGVGFQDFRPQPETETPTPSFEHHAAAASEVETSAARRDLVADIPTDITPDELDALSALVARLDAPASAEESTTQEATTHEGTTTDCSENDCREFETLTPVSAAQFAQEPAPVDGQDEPMFAVAKYLALKHPKLPEPSIPSGYTGVPEEAESQKIVAEVSPSVADEAEPEQFTAEPSYTEFATIEAPNVQDVTEHAVNSALQVEASLPISDELPEQAPVIEAESAESTEENSIVEASREKEVAEALFALTPAGRRAGSFIQPPETLAATGDSSTEGSIAGRLTSPRWTAEPASITPQEAVSSLEAEMFANTANTAAQEAARAQEAAEAEEAAKAQEAAAAEEAARALEATAALEAAKAVEVAAAQEAARAQEAAALQEAALAALGLASAAETAAQPESGQEPTRAKAAAATGEGTSAAQDPGAIANIVDRILADLRPKIVEEITKKLSGN